MTIFLILFINHIITGDQTCISSITLEKKKILWNVTPNLPKITNSSKYFFLRDSLIVNKDVVIPRRELDLDLSSSSIALD